MDQSVAVKHAQEIARQAVRLGLTDLESTKRHYQDYLFYLNLGFEGSFTQILQARKAIDAHTYEVLERLIPFHGASPLVEMPANQRMSSMVVRLPRTAAPPPSPQVTVLAEEVMALPAGAAPAEEKKAHDTLPLDESEIAEELGDRRRQTMALPSIDLPDGGVGADAEDSELDLHFPELDKSTEVMGPQVARLDTSASAELNWSGAEERPERRSGRAPAGSAPLMEMAAAARAAAAQQRLPETASSDSDTNDSEHPSDTSEFIWNNSASGARKPAPEAEPLMPQLGGFLGEFQLLDVLGQGGMGVVFKTRRPGDETTYALKVLRVREGAKAEKRRKRFRREVDAMQRLKHPNIVRVHGYGRDGPFDWFVMDYVDGKPLAALIDDDGLTLEERLEMFAGICAALSHAHSRNVVHRDLKPQNVIVDVDGQPHLLDFGLAKIVDEETELTRTGAALGTPFYMSPEHVNDPANIEPRSDVFSLGVLLYELVTGKRPFTGVSAGEVGNKVLTHDPPRPSKLNPEVPPNVDAICLKALEKSPARRYPSVTALRQDVLQHVKGAELKKATVLDDARRFYERNRSGMQMGLLVASVFFSLVGIAAGLVYLLSG